LFDAHFSVHRAQFSVHLGGIGFTQRRQDANYLLKNPSLGLWGLACHIAFWGKLFVFEGAKLASPI